MKMVSTELLPALRDSKNLTPETLKEIAHRLDMPLSRVAGAASFYSEFRGETDGEADLRFLHGGTEGAMFAHANWEKIKACAAQPESIIPLLKESGLRGRSGSSFPIADKWQLTKEAPGQEKYIIANGSEGEGNTFKDLKLMVKAPHAILEGIFLCASAVGAKKAFIYVRGEYPEAMAAMESAVKENASHLGGLEVEVVRGAGAYVCGEETALIRAIVGLRGEPVLKPPFPGTDGVFHKPTVINNVESFAAVAAFFKSGGISKLFTVSGCVEAPGVYELPYGMTVGEIGALAGVSKTVNGYQLGGGATGRILKDFGLRLDPATPMGTAAIYFFDDGTSARSLAADSLAFLSAQSCGKCVPCRYGTVELARLLKENGNAEDIRKLCRYLKMSSRCAFGISAPTSAESAMLSFPEEFEEAAPC